MSLSLVKSIITELPNGKLWKMHLLCFAHLTSEFAVVVG